MLVPVREYACASEMLSALLAIRRGFRAYERPVVVPPPPVVNVVPRPARFMPKRFTPKGPFGAYLFRKQPVIPRVTVTDVLQTVSAVWGIAKVHIISQRRNRGVMRPRQAAYALACRLTTASLPQIGKAIGGRDHSSIVHGRNRMQPVLDRVEARIRPDASVWEWAVELRKEMGV